MAATPIHQLRSGVFFGNPAGLASQHLPNSRLKLSAEVPDGVLWEEALAWVPELAPPAVWLPYNKVGRSATDIQLIDQNGRFGPFDGQLLVGEFTNVEINRVFLEKVGGEYQGACFRFLDHFPSAVLRLAFDPGLAGGTINLNGPIVPPNTVTIDGSDAPGISLNGGGFDRVLVVDPDLNVTVKGLILTNGYGFQLAGGVLNNGTLTLENVVVTGNTMTTDAGDFWQGGGGIYNGSGATLNLIDSTVSNNSSGWAGGGVFSFFGTTTHVERSTISGNSAVDVGGGMRTLGNVSLLNSTLSGNSATAWHGAAVFVTDGVMNVTNSTIASNTGPGGTAAVFVGTFTASGASLNIQNSIVANNTQFGCFLAPFGAGPVAFDSLGNNVFSDGTCFATGSDQVVGNALLGPLASNGGSTQTHALLSGSPAIDAANAAACPATDQRGIARPQGPGCDAGAFELE